MIILEIISLLLFIILLFVLVLLFSYLEINVKNFSFNSENEGNRKIEDYLVFLKLKFLNKITYLKIKIDDNKIKKVKKYKILNNKTFNIPFKKTYIRNITKFEQNIKELNLVLSVGLIDTTITSLAVVVISSILSILISRNTNNYKSCKYKILPDYTSKLEIKVNLSGIFNFKVVHIINILYMLLKEGSVSNDERTSYRRSYDKCNG